MSRSVVRLELFNNNNFYDNHTVIHLGVYYSLIVSAIRPLSAERAEETTSEDCPYVWKGL